MKTAALALSAVLLFPVVAFCQSSLKGTGLETGGDLRVNVLVENLNDTALRMGLSERQAGQIVEIKLRQYGITPTTREVSMDQGWYLYVNISVFGDAYHIGFRFTRDVYYWVGDVRYWRMASTWNNGITGHGGGGYIADILDSLRELADSFSMDFLKANGK